MIAERATIVIYEEYRARRKQYRRSIKTAPVNGAGAAVVRMYSMW